MTLTVRAAAKINLLLGVGAPRPDGFHTLVTVYQAISLYDDLTVTAADELTVATDGAAYIDTSHLPPAGHNIVDRAAAGLAALHGRQVGADVRVDKAIPIAGGLAGGSADHDLLVLATELGSDVPFALHGGTALGEGHGEVVTPLVDEGSWWWVVVPSDEGMSTPAVYRHYDEVRPDAPPEPDPPDEVLAALASGDPGRHAGALHNDHEQAAGDLRPDLPARIVEGVDAGALRGLLSGSGPTCVFLCESADHARSVAAALTADRDQRVVLVAHGPVAGAHVVTS